MKLLGTLNRILQALFGKEMCNHYRVQLSEHPSHCPDCGYLVQLHWVLLHCNTCQAKRVPHKTLRGEIIPVDSHCRHCGDVAVTPVHRTHVEAYELMYALCTRKTTMVHEAFKTTGPKKPTRPKVVVDDHTISDAVVIQRPHHKAGNNTKPTLTLA